MRVMNTFSKERCLKVIGLRGERRGDKKRGEGEEGRYEKNVRIEKVSKEYMESRSHIY